MIRCSFMVLLISVISLGACSQKRGADAGLQREAALLLQSVERLRQAPNADKQARLADLVALLCSYPETCALKDRCTDAYQGFVKALNDIARIEAALTANAAFGAADLAGAQHALDTAREKTLGCANAQGELARLIGR